MRTIVDPASTFFVACARIFRRPLELAEHGRAILMRDGESAVKLSLEAGERELWVSRVRLLDGELPKLFAYLPTHEERLGEIEVKGSIEGALEAARELLHA